MYMYWTVLTVTEVYINIMAPLPEESDPPSGLPLEYMVASFPSKMNLNQPLLPLESSKAQDSFHR